MTEYVINSGCEDIPKEVNKHYNIKKLKANDGELVRIRDNLPDSIEEFIFERNKVNDLPNKFPKKLRILNFSSNLIQEIKELSEHIEMIIGESNYIHNIPKDLSKYINLTVINLSTNFIKDDSYESWPPKLEELNLSFNRLESFPLNLPKTLKKLSLKFNKIKEISDISDLCIQELDMSHNQLQKIEILCPTLVTLILENNQITDIPDVWPKSLKTLCISDNQIKEIKGQFDSLEELELSNNPLVNISLSSDTLWLLDISHTQLTTFPRELSLNKNLHELTVNYCLFEEIELLDFPRLESFFCSFSRIRSLSASDSLSSLSNLLTINCYHTGISVIPKLPSSIVGIECSNCRIKSLPDLNEGLISLSASGNELTELPNMCTTIQYLNIEDNKITSLNKLLVCINLIKINYEDNPITYIPEAITRILTKQDSFIHDKENIHSSSVQGSMTKNIIHLLEEENNYTLERLIEEIREDDVLTEISKQELLQNINDPNIHSVLRVSFLDVFRCVWQRINRHSESKGIKEILNQELIDSVDKCFTGRITRIVNCLVGIFPDINLEISKNEQISNIVCYHLSRNSSKDTIINALKELGLEQEEINLWI